jgi:hypothetical protein
MLKIKSGEYGARLTPLSAAVAVFMIVDHAMVHESLDYDLSGGIEGEHIPGSIHFLGLAWDFTVRNSFVPDRGERMRKLVADNLGDDFDVEWKPEKARLHVEFQPKRSFGRLGP